MKKSDIRDTLVNIIESRPGPGIDNINIKAIKRNNLEKVYVDLAYDVLKKSKPYSFSKYKQFLRNKGKDKPPRIISIPTIRDRLILRCLHDYYLDFIDRPKANDIISSIYHDLLSNKFDSCIKLDITNFYGSIDISLLCNDLRNEKVKNNIVSLIDNALSTITIDQINNRKSTKKLKDIKIGVPQGIIISNCLGELYLKDFDQYFMKDIGIKYYRFVDDILILYNKKNTNPDVLIDEISNKLKAKNLELNKEKTELHSTTDTIDFLGYRFERRIITVKKEVIYSKEKQLERMVFDTVRASNKRIYNNLDLLTWKLNNLIAGFISGGMVYGWVQVYKLINDVQVFYKLDATLRKVFKRAGIAMPGTIKHFSKAYMCLSNKNTSYCVNFDKEYGTIKKKRELLVKLLGIKSSTKAAEVNDLFRMLVRKTIYDAEKDLDFKYQIHWFIIEMDINFTINYKNDDIKYLKDQYSAIKENSD